MAYALVTHTGAGSSDGNNVTTSSIDTSGANLIVIVVSTFGGMTDPTDNKGNTWTGLTVQPAGTSDRQARLYYCVSPTVGSGHTFTVTSSGKAPAIAVASFSGAATSSTFDQQNGASNTIGTTIATGSVTPSANNELLVAGYGGYSNDCSAIDSGFTLLDHGAAVGGQHDAYGLAYSIQTTATAANPTFTAGTVAAAAIATFTAAAGGGGSSVGADAMMMMSQPFVQAGGIF